MSYRYGAELAGVPNCPAEHFQPRAIEAFRFVARDRLTNSFRPILVLNPKRALKMSDLDQCGGWALSFFVSLATARAKFEALRKVNPKIDKTLGNSVAAGQLQTTDGVCCQPDEEGHFELHEYASSNLADRFQVVEALV